MFEYEGKYYNPRFVFSIGPLKKMNNEYVCFDVTWEDGASSNFMYRPLDAAQQARDGLVFQVNQINGAA